MTLQIFLDIFNQERGTWLGKVNEPSCLLNLSNKKNLLLAQIKSPSLLEQKAALPQLLINFRFKIWSLCRVEKTHKHLWLVKKVKNEFREKPS